MLAGAPGHTPTRRFPAPRTQLVKTATGGPLDFFSYTRMRQYSPIGLYNRLNNHEIEVILVFHEDVFIADLQCAMTRPEMLYVIYSLNANIDVYVHEDLHDVYL